MTMAKSEKNSIWVQADADIDDMIFQAQGSSEEPRAASDEMRPARRRRGPTVPLKHRSLPKKEAAAVFSVFSVPTTAGRGAGEGNRSR